MTINDVQFSMKIQRLQVNPNNGIKENVVHRVHWSLEARYTDPVTGEEFMAPLDDVTTIQFVDSAGYVPFENLTEGLYPNSCSILFMFTEYLKSCPSRSGTNSIEPSSFPKD